MQNVYIFAHIFKNLPTLSAQYLSNVRRLHADVSSPQFLLICKFGLTDSRSNFRSQKNDFQMPGQINEFTRGGPAFVVICLSAPGDAPRIYEFRLSATTLPNLRFFPRRELKLTLAGGLAGQLTRLLTEWILPHD